MNDSTPIVTGEGAEAIPTALQHLIPTDPPLHFGAQVYISRSGNPISNFGVGRTGSAESGRGDRDASMFTNHLLPWYSNTKPVTAAAVLTLVDSNQLHLDDLVTRFIPEFAAGGKEAITIRHLLTHTSGFREADLSSAHTWDETIASICAAPIEPDWVPGERAGYHAETSWYVLGEVARRISGTPFAAFVRQTIFDPLEMNNSYIGMSPDEFQRLQSGIATIYLTERDTTPTPREATDTWRHSNPGAGGIGPAHELGRFYEMLLGDGAHASRQILSPGIVQQMTSRQRVGMFDETFRHKIDWGLGIIVNSRKYGVETVPYGFGRYASETTFGHGGRQTSIAFADPESQLVVVAIWNGAPGEPRHHRRAREFASAVYKDLGLAS